MESAVPDAAFMAAATKQGWLKVSTDRLPQPDAHRVIQTADSLLIIQPHSVLQVPGKLFEYLQIGRPILAFVPPESPVERILQRSGVRYTCAYTTSSPGELDESILRFLSLDGPDEKPNAWFENEFNAENHAGRVSELIQSIGRQRKRA